MPGESFSPPSLQGHCLPWRDNVSAAPTYEGARRIIFTGSQGHYLHVVDADTGVNLVHIPTPGRVVTAVVSSPSKDKIYFGTDKGWLIGLDAFNFAELFRFEADSALANNIEIVGEDIVFSTALATIYAVNPQGQERFRIDRPLKENRLRLLANSTILVAQKSKLETDKYQSHSASSRRLFVICPFFQWHR